MTDRHDAIEPPDPYQDTPEPWVQGQAEWERDRAAGDEPAPYTLSPEADAALTEYESLGFASALDEFGSIAYESARMFQVHQVDAGIADFYYPGPAAYEAISAEALAAMGPESVMTDLTATNPDAWCGPDCRYDAAAEEASDAEAWGGKGPSGSYAEWVAEGREAEAGS
jgi:hypothetical protein